MSTLPTVFGQEDFDATRRIKEWIEEQHKLHRRTEIQTGSTRVNGVEFKVMCISSHSPNIFGGERYHGTMCADGVVRYWA